MLIQMNLKRFNLLNYFSGLRARESGLRKNTLRKGLTVAGLLGGALWYEIQALAEFFDRLLPQNVGMTSAKVQDSNFIRAPRYSENDGNGDERKLVVETLIQSKFPGLQLHHLNPFYFLRIAQSSSVKLEQRQAALLALAYSFDLDDGTCRELAQSLDLKTTVQLAQVHDVNLKLFLPPPYQRQTDDSIDSSFRRILERFPDKNHNCAVYYSEKAHTTQHKLKDQEKKFNARKQSEPWRISYLYLQSLLLHSESVANVEALVQAGGLSVLWHAYQTYHQPLIRSQIVQIVSNVAMYPEHHVHLFQSGWLGILAQLLKDSSVSISVPAAKALANMDDLSRNIGVYDSSVFLLHPVAEHRRDVDVVFVHGLLGGVFWTWRQHDAAQVLGDSEYTKCWPRDWLPEDVDGLRVLAVDYDTYLSQWKPTCPEEREERSIKGRSEHLLTSLKKAGLGSKPIVWVAHSMGGLIVKQLLLSAETSSDPELKSIVNQSRALVMLSVPHQGSALASLNPTIRFILLPSIEVQELQKGSARLAELHDKFLAYLKAHRMAVLSLVETRPTLIAALRSELRIVDRESADAGVGEIHYVPATHLDICKPFNKDSFVYKRLVKLLRGVKAGSPPRDLASNS